jgi:hypothetical protein
VTLIPAQSQATSDADGNITFTWPQADPPPGTALEGTISVPLAPTAAFFVCNVGGVPTCTGAGNAQMGPVQAIQGNPVTVQGINMAPDTTYLATWTYVVLPLEQAQDNPPTPVASTVTISSSTDVLPVDLVGIDGVDPVTDAANIVQVTLTGAGSPFQLPSIVAKRGFTLYANPNNAAQVGIGTSIASQPLSINPGAYGPGFPLNNTDIIYVEGSVGDHLELAIV